jgi:hypothetical protein
MALGIANDCCLMPNEQMIKLFDSNNKTNTFAVD